MSPRNAGTDKAAPEGSGPGGRITPDDIRGKLAEVTGGAETKVQAARPLLTYVAVGGVVAVALVAFWLGRRNGRQRSTIVEIRRG
jgi:pyruvate/2-oxoglutarate dehydrogenase complex dihydrolipoamide acyltransferase (E2) component